MGVAQNSRARATQVFVFVSVYQGSSLGTLFDPQPYGVVFFPKQCFATPSHPKPEAELQKLRRRMLAPRAAGSARYGGTGVERPKRLGMSGVCFSGWCLMLTQD